MQGTTALAGDAGDGTGRDARNLASCARNWLEMFCSPRKMLETMGKWWCHQEKWWLSQQKLGFNQQTWQFNQQKTENENQNVWFDSIINNFDLTWLDHQKCANNIQKLEYHGIECSQLGSFKGFAPFTVTENISRDMSPSYCESYLPPSPVDWLQIYALSLEKHKNWWNNYPSQHKL